MTKWVDLSRFNLLVNQVCKLWFCNILRLVWGDYWFFFCIAVFSFSPIWNQAGCFKFSLLFDYICCMSWLYFFLLLKILVVATGNLVLRQWNWAESAVVRTWKVNVKWKFVFWCWILAIVCQLQYTTTLSYFFSFW